MGLFTMSCYVGMMWEVATDAGKHPNPLPTSFLSDGSLSDTAVSSLDALDRQRNMRLEARGGRGAGPGGAGGNAASPSGPGLAGGGGMGKKSNSTSQLSAAGRAF